MQPSPVVTSRWFLNNVRGDLFRGWSPLVLVAIGLAWSYWPTIEGLTHQWDRDANYSVGKLVPLAALYLLWQERRVLSKCKVAPCWWGVAILLLGQAARAFGLLFLYESAERYSLVLTIAGLVLLVAGRAVFREVRWILLFLFLMVPLPGKIHNLISGPLQNQATSGAVFALELLGVTVLREGNVIVLNDDIPLGVAEACSGLRMLTAFVVVGSVLAYVARRPWWQKTALLLSTVPVAIVCNVFRLAITAELFLVASSDTAEQFFHGFAGWTMMPLAIGILVFELWIMSRLVIPSEHPT